MVIKHGIIGIYGATGFTGSLIARILDANQTPFLLAGRDESKLQAISQNLISKPRYIIANVDSPEELREFCKQCQVVINCVGPFLRWGNPVVEAALQQGCHYLDITAEQPFIKRVYDRYHTVAQSHGLCVISGAGLESAVSDLHLSSWNFKLDKAYSLKVAYIKTGLSPKSMGTRLSMLEMIPLRQGWSYRDGEWRLELITYKRSCDMFDGKPLMLTHYPGGDVIHAPLTLPSLQRVDTYMAGLPPTRVIKVVQLIAQIPGIFSLMQQYVLRGSSGPTKEQRSQRSFTILHEIAGEKDGHQLTKCYAIAGRDPYGLTAQCIAEMAERLNKGLYSRTGVCSPASTFDAVSFVKQLQAWGVTVTPTDINDRW